MKPLVAALVLLMSWASVVRAADVTLAVASNFLPAAERLVEAFEAETGLDVTEAHGSTGQIYAQLRSGAPFDVFLAADMERPERLAEEELATEVRPYALGRLVLVTREPVTDETLAAAIEGRNVALADPTVAPYGLAATSAMESLRLDTARFQPILVANVGQVATVFATGNADFAFIAASLLPRLSDARVLDLEGRYPPIRQGAALMSEPGENDAVDAFWRFLFSPEAAAIIETAGYGLPE